MSKRKLETPMDLYEKEKGSDFDPESESDSELSDSNDELYEKNSYEIATELYNQLVSEFNIFKITKNIIKTWVDYFLNYFATFKVVLTHVNSKLPIKAEPGSAGYDVFSVEDKLIFPNSRSLINIGLKTEFSKNYYLRCAPRSGLSLKGIDVGAGVIDSSYRGEIKVLLINNSTYLHEVKVGDKIAQLILEKIANPKIKVLQCLSESERNESGFGSSGN